MASVVDPTALREISSAAEMEKMEKERQWRREQTQIERELREAFMERDVHPEAIERINKAVRRAAEQGLHEIEALTFPSKFCNDRGRSINNMDPDWPQSLEGFAKRAYDFFDRELRPHGFKLAAQIVSFPDGMPGDVAIYLRW